jgi:glycosyl transferase, family 25
MNVFVINLKSSVQRRAIMEKQFNKLNIPYEIFEAVKGADVSEQDIAQYYDMDYYNSRPGYFTPGAVGCTLSHYFIYKKMVEEKIPVAVILEDDMILNSQFAELTATVAKQIRHDEVVLLFYQSYEKILLSSPASVALTGKYQLYQVVNTALLRSTGGYMITYEGAKSMLEKSMPFSSFPDDWKSFYDRKILNGVRLVYPYVLTNSYEPTTISPYTKGKWLLKIKSVVEKYHIFPFHLFLKWRRKKYIEKTRQCVISNDAPVDLRQN